MRTPLLTGVMAALLMAPMSGCQFRHVDLPSGASKSSAIWLKGFESTQGQPGVVVLRGEDRSSAWSIHRVKVTKREGIVLIRAYMGAPGLPEGASRVYTDGNHLQVPITLAPDVQGIAWGRWDNLIWTSGRGSLLDSKVR